MRFAVITFPGSNCDHDVFHATKEVLNQPTDMLWYDQKQDLSGYDCIILPGGFSYGDYLRSGAIARFARIMESVINYAEQGGLILGICNGFQILLEADLLPGAMKINDSLKFTCRFSRIRVENNKTPFTICCQEGEVLNIPVAHGEGNYYIDPDGLQSLIKNDQIVVRYEDDRENPNGSVDNIAGICNKEGNVFGLMPHPERCSENILGGPTGDGYKIFSSILQSIKERGELIGHK